jgi:hypothetical protein
LLLLAKWDRSELGLLIAALGEPTGMIKQPRSLRRGEPVY